MRKVQRARLIQDGQDDGKELHWFWCPGCDRMHAFETPRWAWNGDEDKPTYAPSLVTVEGDVRCHLFLRDGRLEFLADSTHKLAGQGVALGPLPEGS